MDRDTTIPSILSPMGNTDDTPKSSGDGTILKLVFWGAIALALVMVVRYWVR